MLSSRCFARALAVVGVVVAIAGTAGAATGRLGPEPHVKVVVSVPVAIASTGKRVWVANSGTSSLLEFNAATGVEMRDVSGKRFQLDIPSSICVHDDHVWVANAASDTVTEINAKTGGLLRLLGAPKHNFEVPAALVVADRHLFILDHAGDKVIELNEATGAHVQVLSDSSYHFSHTVAMVAVGDDVWTANDGGRGSLTEFSAATGRRVRIVTAARAHIDVPTALAATEGKLLVAGTAGDHVAELSDTSGRFVKVITVKHLQLNGATSLAAAGGVVWAGFTAGHGLVAGFRQSNGSLVHRFTARFGYPVVVADGSHVWVMDRTESRITELRPSSGAIVRIITN